MNNTISESVREVLQSAGCLTKTRTTVKGQPAHKLSTIKRRVATLSKLHQEQRIPESDNPARNPQVVKLLRAGKKLSHNAIDQKRPLTREKLEKLYAACDAGTNELQKLRDRALIAVAYDSGGRRCSEALGIRCEDLKREYVDSVSGPELRFLLRLSRGTKTTNAAEEMFDLVIGASAAIFLDDWLEASGIKTGPIFRGIRPQYLATQKSMSSVAMWKRIKELCMQAGLDARDFSPHSIRAGFVTDAINDGVPLPKLMRKTKHRSESVLATYYRQAAAESQEGSQMDKDLV